MPNHVINNIRISGDTALIRELLESVQADEQSLGSIDFNKIIPMPESLKIECGSNTDKGLKAFTDFTQVYTLAGTREDADIENIPKEAEKAFLRIRSDITPEQWSLGKLAYENQCKYGVPTWYEWSINNWGTKWNAYAEQLLCTIRVNGCWSAAIGTLRLLQHLGKVIQSRLDNERQGKAGAIDRKLKRKIDEKKQAHGLKQG